MVYLPDRHFFFGILHPHLPSPEADFTTPIDLGAGVSLERVPEFLKDPDFTGRLSLRARRLIERRAKLTLSVHGPLMALYAASLSLWLARPSHVTLAGAVHAGHDDDHPMEFGWVPHCWRQVERLRPHPEYHRARLLRGDLDTAKTLNIALVSLSTDSTVTAACWTLWSALTSPAWESRYIMLWVVLEGLFGASTPGETIYRLAHRLAVFLGDTPEQASGLYREAVLGYQLRSKIVHGRRLRAKDMEGHHALTWRVEQMVQRALITILGSHGLLESFNGRQRETFLDGLLFSRLQTR